MESNNQNYNTILNGAFQNQVNNQMMNSMMQNSIYNPMYPNPMYNPILNFGMMPNMMFNGMMQNPMYNQIFNGNMLNQNYFNSEIINQMNNLNINNNIENNIKNIPIEGSIKLELDNNEQIQYYLYPKIEFTDEEINNVKTLLIIGQTGHGKTTFVNAMVNIYMGINFNDKFRYLLIRNENNEQLKSITKEITIYKIRAKKELNFPPLILIDTPGFGDTSGEKEDKMNLIKFKEFFNSKAINYINCILYIIIGANARFGENDKKIINYLLNLFGKNVKDNFVVDATNFIPESKKDIPNIIKSLSNENHFYYQNVLKNDLLSKEQIAQSYWYFTSDNKIISNNQIEGNEREKEKWKYTESEIKKFIENKIKILEKKDTEESGNVLNNRIQLEEEINGLTEKLDRLISKMSTFEYNIFEQKKYRELIISIKDKIQKNNYDKKNIFQSLKEINKTLPYVKKIINQPIKSNKENLICKTCESNCHKNCGCNFTILNKWFCNMISFKGNCKICGHGVSEHIKGKFLFIQQEEKEQLIHNDFDELEKYIEFLSNKKEEEILHMHVINKDNNLLEKTLNTFNEQIDKISIDIENVKIQYTLVENELIETLNNIKKNLDFLRANALNEEKRTIKTFIEEHAKNKNEQEKIIIKILFQKFIELNK